MSPACILWFQNDLRLRDHPAFFHAVREGYEILPVYIHDPRAGKEWKPGSVSRWWRHEALRHLSGELSSHGLKLVLRRGDAGRVLPELARETGASAVVWSRCYEPGMMERDRKLCDILRKDHVESKSFKTSLLYEPWEIKNKQGGPYKVYSAFRRACRLHGDPPKPLRFPSRKVKAYSGKVRSENLNDWNLHPAHPWIHPLEETWEPSPRAAGKLLSAFKTGPVKKYDTQRDIPGCDGTSRLSPYLHFGQISVREVWHAIAGRSAHEVFRRQILWREFAHHLLYHFPGTPAAPLVEKFREFPWRRDTAHLRAWQRGQTGFPIVDAGMRQLWRTGWMHNRVRMITGSFLVKDLLIPWQEGANWFWDTLADADLANNTLGWQWVAGCGADAAPYFRIFNPVTQGEKFDPLGLYVKKWVPELRGMPLRWIHRPWEAPADVLRTAGIRLDREYPAPVVDHAFARKRALLAYDKIR